MALDIDKHNAAIFQILWVRNKYGTWDKELRQASDGQLIRFLEQKISNEEYFKRKLAGTA